MEQLKALCKNPWCKATFFYKESDMIVVIDDSRTSKIDGILNEVQKTAPRQCNKCKSFNSELSGGVDWKDKEYEGSRFDGSPHQFSYKVTNFKL